MGLFKEKHNCSGPVEKTDYVFVKTPGTGPSFNTIGAWTRTIRRCSECGRIFESRAVPGKWTVAELNS